ncbi:hypothetical protein RCL1_005636 [Eukaryota sp. TZLM3-RCL]
MPNFFHSPIQAKLQHLRSKSDEDDLVLSFNGDQLSCFSHLLSTHCSFLQDNTSSFIDLSSLSDVSLVDVNTFIDIFYGFSVNVSKENSAALLSLSRFLKCNELETICEDVAKSPEYSFTKPVDFFKLGTFLHLTAPTDFTIVYRGSSLPIHRLILSTFCSYFQTKWSVNCPDTNASVIDFSDKFFFPIDEFLYFFSLLYATSFDIVNNCHYSFYHLSKYFGFNELLSFTKKEISITQPSPAWCEHSLIMANDHEDLEFLELFSTKLNNWPSYSQHINYFLRPSVFTTLAKSLKSKNSVFWLVGCLHFSFTSNVITSDTFITCLDLLNVSDEVDLVSIYNTLEELRHFKAVASQISQFFCDKIFPRIIKKLSKVPTPPPDIETTNSEVTSLRSRVSSLEQKCCELERSTIKLDADRLTAIYTSNKSSASFYNLGQGLKTDNRAKTKIIVTDSSVDTRSCLVSHPPDGKIVFTITNYGIGTSVGFVCEETKKFLGFSFCKRNNYSSCVNCIELLGSTYLIPEKQCSVVISFNFSTTRTVCFQVPVKGVYCTTDIPVNSNLQVDLKNVGTECCVTL